MKKTVAIIFAIIIISSVFSNTYSAKSKQVAGNKCFSCHQDIYEIVSRAKYSHMPALNDCTSCHRKEEEESFGEDAIVVDTEIPLRKFIIHLPEVDLKDKYKVEIVLRDEYDNEGEPYEIIIDPEKIKEFSDRYGSLKKIKNLRLADVRGGVYFNAMVKWETDVPATTVLEFWRKGVKGRHYRIEYPGVYSWDHVVEITQLNRKYRYMFNAISTDIWGQKIKSATGELKLSEFKKTEEREDDAEEDDEPPELKKAEIFRLKGKKGVFILINTSRPSCCTISLYKQVVKKEVNDHFYKVDRYASIDACNKCHEFTVSHPVGVRAESEHVNVPDDLFTIEDGMITCATCHFPHGADRPFLARLDFREDLCLKCHDETIYEK